MKKAKPGVRATIHKIKQYYCRVVQYLVRQALNIGRCV